MAFAPPLEISAFAQRRNRAAGRAGLDPELTGAGVKKEDTISGWGPAQIMQTVMIPDEMRAPF